MTVRPTGARHPSVCSTLVAVTTRKDCVTISFAHSNESIEFRRIVQRSEEHRAMVMLGILVCLALIVIVRDFAGDGVIRGAMFFVILGLIVLVAAVEVGTLVVARRADAKGALVDARVWFASVAAESLTPTAAILAMQLSSPAGLIGGLVAPTVLIYGIVCALAVLRLQPLLCFLAGAIGGAGHALLVTYAWWSLSRNPEAIPPGAVPFSPFVLYSYSAIILVAGVACAAVAGEVRRWVFSMLIEQTQRRRVEVVARNTLIFGLAKLAEYRDSDTGSHLERISAYCQLLCVPLRANHPEIDAAWVDRLTLASSMHDIGKVGIPDAVLLKPGRLDDEERRIIQQHPDFGYRALDAILRRGGRNLLLEMSADIAACHHERWDGKGYPNGLAGERIPLAARIVAVADVYDALTSVRAYKPAMSHEEAAKLIREGSGTQFDPEVVEAFNRMESHFRAVRERYAEASAEEGRAGASPAAPQVGAATSAAAAPSAGSGMPRDGGATS